MTIAAAALALIDRVEPYWVISTTRSAAASASGAETRPLLAEEQHAPLGEFDRVDRQRALDVVDRDHRQ